MRLPATATEGYNLVRDKGLVIQHADGSLYDRVENIFRTKVEMHEETCKEVKVTDGTSCGFPAPTRRFGEKRKQEAAE